MAGARNHPRRSGNGLGWIDVEWNRCKTRASLPLRAIRRPPETPIWSVNPYEERGANRQIPDSVNQGPVMARAQTPHRIRLDVGELSVRFGSIF